MALSGFLQKLLFVNQFSINEGKIDILGSRYIMLEASDILLLQAIDTTKTYSMGKSMAKKQLSSLIEHAKVYQGIKSESIKNIAGLNKKIEGSEEGKVKILEDIFNLYGLGKLDIVNIDNKKMEAIVKVENSTIASEYLKDESNTKKKKCTCVLTAGILAGIFTFLFKKNIQCVEEKCISGGEESCIFRIS